MSNLESVVEWIKSGEFDDGDAVKQIMDAIRFRVAAGAIGFEWVLTLPEITIAEDDLMHGAWEDIEGEIGQSWLLFQPNNRSISPGERAKRIGALARAVFHHHLGMTRDEAAEKVRTYNSKQLVEALSERQVEDPPKD